MTKTNITGEHKAHNVIANGTTIKGEIIANSDIRIDGVIEGTLKSSGHVIIGDDGFFKGTLTSKDIDVWGKMEGTLIASDVLNLRHSGKIIGDIIVGSLVIEQGAEFNGTCKMGAEAKAMAENHAQPQAEAKQQPKTDKK